MMFGLSDRDALWWANEIRIWSAGGAGVLAIVAFLAQWAHIRASSAVSALKDEEFRRYQVAAEERVALAQKAGAEANAEAARAHERSAALEKEAAEARVAQEQIKERVAWRSLTPAARARLASALRNGSGRITVAYVANDPEALFFAQIIAASFASAGWQVNGEARTYPDRLYWEVIVPDQQGAEADIIRNAFQVVGITYSTEELPVPTMSFGSPQNGTTVIMIGSKRPPF